MFDPYRVRYRRNYYPRKGQVIRPKLIGKKPVTIRPELIDDYKNYFISNKILQDSTNPQMQTFNFIFDPNKSLYINTYEASKYIFGTNSIAGGNWEQMNFTFTFASHNMFYNEYYNDESGNHVNIHGVLYRLVTNTDASSNVDPKDFDYDQQSMESSIIFYSGQDNFGIVDSTYVILQMVKNGTNPQYRLEGFIKPNYTSQTDVMFTNATPEQNYGSNIIYPWSAFTTDNLTQYNMIKLAGNDYMSRNTFLTRTWLEHYPIVIKATETVISEEEEPEYTIDDIEVDWSLPLPSIYATCSLLTTNDPADDNPGEE